MQEEVTQKTIALSMKTGKLTAQALQAALKKYLQHRAKGPKLHHGKQSLNLSSVKDRFGIYALVDKNENREKGIRKPRASVRKQLSETKQAVSPKKAATRSKQYEMEV